MDYQLSTARKKEFGKEGSLSALAIKKGQTVQRPPDCRK